MPGVFEYPVAYVESVANFMAVAPDAAKEGVKGLAVKLWDGGIHTANATALGVTSPDGVRLRQMGFVLGAWACPRKEPEACVREVVQVGTALRTSFAVFETEYEYASGQVSLSRLLPAWRAARPRQYTGLAVEGGVADDFQHAVAIEHDCYLLPETYWKVHGSYDPSVAYWKALRLGWPLARVKPTVTGVEGHDICESLLRVGRCKPLGYTTGYMLWRGDMLNAEQYRLVGLTKETLSA